MIKPIRLNSKSYFVSLIFFYILTAIHLLQHTIIYKFFNNLFLQTRYKDLNANINTSIDLIHLIKKPIKKLIKQLINQLIKQLIKKLILRREMVIKIDRHILYFYIYHS